MVAALLEGSGAWGSDGDGVEEAHYWGCWCGGVRAWSKEGAAPLPLGPLTRARLHRSIPHHVPVGLPGLH